MSRSPFSVKKLVATVSLSVFFRAFYAIYKKMYSVFIHIDFCSSVSDNILISDYSLLFVSPYSYNLLSTAQSLDQCEDCPKGKYCTMACTLPINCSAGYWCKGSKLS